MVAQDGFHDGQRRKKKAHDACCSMSPHLTLKDTCKNAGQIEKKFILKSVIDKFKECN